MYMIVWTLLHGKGGGLDIGKWSDLCGMVEREGGREGRGVLLFTMECQKLAIEKTIIFLI